MIKAVVTGHVEAVDMRDERADQVHSSRPSMEHCRWFNRNNPVSCLPLARVWGDEQRADICCSEGPLHLLLEDSGASLSRPSLLASSV